MSQENARLQGSKQALEDWNSKKVYHLVNGCLASSVPAMNRKIGFYYANYHHTDSEADDFFCEGYNETIRQLVQENGFPDWAPIVRLPSRHQLLDLLKDGVPFSSYHSQSVIERRIVSLVSSKWPTPPLIYKRIPEKEILVIGGDSNPRCGRIDVIDLREMLWLDTNEYMRRHFPQLPWDNS